MAAGFDGYGAAMSRSRGQHFLHSRKQFQERVMQHQTVRQGYLPLSVRLENEVSLTTPKAKLELGNVPLILSAAIAYGGGEEGDSEMLTPQRKLLNSIELVQMLVMEELNRLKATPAAKEAERERKVKILMSMR